ADEDVRVVLPRYDKFKSKIIEHHEIYLKKKKKSTAEIEALYVRLDKSGILGDFIRRTQGENTEPRLACAIEDWLDLRMELKEKGFGELDPVRVNEMLDRKAKSYFLKRKKVGDREYILRWLKD